jgi:hypothetical protein
MQVVVLTELDAQTGQDFPKSLEVHGLVIDEHAVEIEERGRKHLQNLPQNPYNLADVAREARLCQLPPSQNSEVLEATSRNT